MEQRLDEGRVCAGREGVARQTAGTNERLQADADERHAHVESGRLCHAGRPVIPAALFAD